MRMFFMALRDLLKGAIPYIKYRMALLKAEAHILRELRGVYKELLPSLELTAAAIQELAQAFEDTGINMLSMVKWKRMHPVSWRLNHLRRYGRKVKYGNRIPLSELYRSIPSCRNEVEI